MLELLATQKWISKVHPLVPTWDPTTITYVLGSTSTRFRCWRPNGVLMGACIYLIKASHNPRDNARLIPTTSIRLDGVRCNCMDDPHKSNEDGKRKKKKNRELFLFGNLLQIIKLHPICSLYRLVFLTIF
jgi:hypothetical protein